MFSFVARIRWGVFNEPSGLIKQSEAYCNRFGHYPESEHADKIYRNRGSRKFYKKHGIRLTGPALGRLPAQVEKQLS